jgi:LysM repeat protein
VVVPQPTLAVQATTVSVEGIPAATPLPGTLPTAVVPAVTVEAPAQVVVPAGTIAAYTVQDGDTLFSIALQFDTDVETLRSLNNLSDDLLQVGQVLQVPATAAQVVPGTDAGTAGTATGSQPVQVVAGVEYVVQSGDTLSSIGERFGVEWQDIAATNNIAAPAYAIYRGQKLVIPGAQTAPAPAGPAGGTGQTHTVQAGETLYSIAVQYGVTVQDIMEANNLANANLIYRGQVLAIPAP